MIFSTQSLSIMLFSLITRIRSISRSSISIRSEWPIGFRKDFRLHESLEGFKSSVMMVITMDWIFCLADRLFSMLQRCWHTRTAFDTCVIRWQITPQFFLVAWGGAKIALPSTSGDLNFGHGKRIASLSRWGFGGHAACDPFQPKMKRRRIW